MEEKIIQALYHGNLDPSTKAVTHGSEYEKHQQNIRDAVTALEKNLAPTEREALESVMSSWMRLDSIGGEERFVEGFKLGARLMLEIFENNDGQLKPLWE